LKYNKQLTIIGINVDSFQVVNIKIKTSARFQKQNNCGNFPDYYDFFEIVTLFYYFIIKYMTFIIFQVIKSFVCHKIIILN